MHNERILTFFTLLVVFSIVSVTVAGQPAIPRTVKGRIMDAGFVNGVENGIPVLINNTVTDTTFLTFTNAPDIPQLKGAYSKNVQGSTGNLMVVLSWNGTHWGTNSSTLASRTTNIDVELNNTRDVEPNVTVIFPSNHSRFDAGAPVPINVSVFWKGLTGTGCAVNITISNTSVLSLPDGESTVANFPTVNYGEINEIIWNATANVTGVTNFTVAGGCDSETDLFDYSSVEDVINITVFDFTDPIVTATAPPNNSFRPNDTSLDFTYNVVDNSTIGNCSFYVNGVLNLTNTSIDQPSALRFNQSFAEGNYSWEIQCTDNSNTPNTGSSGIFNITITNLAAVFPTVTNVTVDNPINLIPNSTKRVYCNATVEDNTGSADIVNLNATFFHSTSTLGAPDDFNVHYSNTTCTNVSSTSNSKSFVCTLNLTYFANASDWTCTVTARDSSDNTATGSANTNVTELFAMGLDTNLIDYGLLDPGNTSPTDANISVFNFGNIPLNLTLRGFGTVVNDNLSMDCTVRNVSVANERYSIAEGTAFGSMNPLTASFQQVTNFTLPHRTNDAAPAEDVRDFFWKIQLPQAIAGRCNGTVSFLAVTS